MKYTTRKQKRLWIFILSFFGVLAGVFFGLMGLKLALVKSANNDIVAKGNYAIGGSTYTSRVESNYKLEPIKFNSNGKVNYLAIGDSVAAGYDASKNKDIMGYPNVMAKYLDDVNKLNAFDKFAFTGITSELLDKVVTGKSTDNEWSSLIEDSKYKFLKKYTDSKGNKISYSDFKKKLDDKIKKSNYITLQSGANNILESISIFGLKMHDLFNPAYLVKNHIVPEGTSTENAVGIYMSDKINDLKNHAASYLSDPSKIININMDNIKQEIANSYSNNLDMVKYIQHLNPDARITLLGYFNPVGFLGLIQKTAGIQTLIDELNKSIEAVSTALINGTNIKKVNFVSFDKDLNHYDVPIDGFGNRSKVYTRYDNLYKANHTAIPTQSQIDEALIYGAGAFTPHITDIHPSAIGQVAIARRLYAFGFKDLLSSVDKNAISSESKDIKTSINDSNNKIDENSWIVKVNYTDSAKDALSVIKDKSFPENNKYFPEDLRKDRLGQEDPLFDGLNVKQRFQNTFNDMLFDKGVLTVLNDFAEQLIDGWTGGIMNALSIGMGKYISPLNAELIKMINGNANDYEQAQNNEFMKFILPVIRQFSKTAKSGKTVLHDTYINIAKGDPASMGFDEQTATANYEESSSNPIGFYSKESEDKVNWLYIDDIASEWFQNVFNLYFFNPSISALGGMMSDLGSLSEPWSRLAIAGNFANVEYEMMKIMITESQSNPNYFKEFARDYWNIVKPNTAISSLMKSKLSGVIPESTYVLIGIEGDIDLRSEILFNLILPSILFRPFKATLEYANTHNVMFRDSIAPADLATIISKIDSLSDDLKAGYSNVIKNYGAI